jgi:RHS repeat-associated protein
MFSTHSPRSQLFVLSLLAGASFIVASCDSSRAPSTGSAAPSGTPMAPSSTAHAVVERAKQLHADVTPHTRRRRLGDDVMLPTAVLAASDADGAFVSGATIVPHVPAKQPTARVTFAATADAARAIALPSGAAVALTMQATTTARAEYADGYLVYRNALAAGGDVIVRPSRDGFEDHVYFATKPLAPSLDYVVTLPTDVAGLRLTSNVLELLDTHGTPLVHTAPPLIVDSTGVTTKATVAVSGCAVDENAQLPWGRRPVAAGASSCHVTVTWNDQAVHYPAVLDPSWTSANTMSMPRAAFAHAVITSASPKIIAAGGYTGWDANYNTLYTNTVDVYDVASGTWSLGPSMATPRGNAAAVYNPATNEVLVTGGEHTSATGDEIIEASTELLTQNAATGAWSWSTSAAMRSARASHRATLLANGKALIAGGYPTAQPQATAHCELYDFATHQLATAPPPDMQQARAQFTVNVVANGNAVLAAGGFDANPSDGAQVDPPTAEVYLASANTWVTVANMPVPHVNHASVSLSQTSVMIIGGWDLQGFQSEADIFTFSPNPPYGAWTSAGSFAQFGRGFAPAAVLANGAVLYASGRDGTKAYGGGYDMGVLDANANLYDPTTGKWQATVSPTASHYLGAADSAVYNGNTTTIVFGGLTSAPGTTDGQPNSAVTATSEVFNLDGNGVSCSGGVTCASGNCVGGVCVPPGFAITIDATSLTQKGLALQNVAAYPGPFDATKPQKVFLPAGTYSLVPYKGLTSVAFTVNGNGTVSYDPSLQGIFAGSGTSTLKIYGRSITVDATHLSQPLALVAYNFSSGAEADSVAIARSSPVEVTLLPLLTGGYQFDVDGANLADFNFSVDTGGFVHIPQAYTYLALGDGTQTLTLGGAHVSLTIPQGMGTATLDGDITLAEGTTSDLYVLPISGGAPFTLALAGNTTTLAIDADGDVTGDPLLLYELRAHGDGAQYCAAQETLAGASGATYAPLNCRAGAGGGATIPAPSTTDPQTITAATLTASPTTGINGPGRPLNQLPRFRRSAGGDPVLGDGEFTMQRTDVALAGYGVSYQFRRTYRSGFDNNGPLGPGWDHNFNQRLLGTVIYAPQDPNFDPTSIGDIISNNCDGTIRYQDGAGGLETFTLAPPYTKTATALVSHYTGQNANLTLEFHWVIGGQSFWQLTDADGTVTVFDLGGFLQSITDRVGNQLTFSWDSATLQPPDPTCKGIDNRPTCIQWLYLLAKKTPRQNRRLARVSDAARAIYYNYSQTDPAQIDDNNRLQCISLSGDCTSANVLLQFTYDYDQRLVGVTRAPGNATALEKYVYREPETDAHACIASADLPSYCNRLCGTKLTDCNNLDYAASTQSFCKNLYCNAVATATNFENDCAAGVDTTLIQNPATGVGHCCRPAQPQKGLNANPTVCESILWGGGHDCYSGCEESYQCQEASNGTTYAVYAAGALRELDNDITDVYDSNGTLTVHNTYSIDQSSVDFDKVISQTIGIGGGDSTITFDYHDLLAEGGLEPTPVYVADGGAPAGTGKWSTPDPVVQQYALAPLQYMQVCPHACPGGGASCAVYDYGAPILQTSEVSNPAQMVAAVVIHDLHGVTRIQYLDSLAEVLREVNATSGEITDYNYQSGQLVGIASADGRRTCYEHDVQGRVTQASLLPNGQFGAAPTLATTFAYAANGYLTDVVKDALGQRIKTHYTPDSSWRTQSIDQDVTAGAAPERTTFAYNGAPSPTGILETPTSITYPNGRVDTFSQFDASLGGPQTIVLDSTSAVPENRYAKYDGYGRAIESGEVNRYATHALFTDANDIFKLTASGHRLDSTKAWVDTAVTSHVVDGQAVIDSIAAPMRTTTLTNVGSYPMQKSLVATAAPPNIALPSTETSCFNYDVDGRLEAAVLPMGNGVAYQYSYASDGTFYVQSQHGYGVDTSGAWAANCRGTSAPTGDPGLSLPDVKHYLRGGWLVTETDENAVTRSYFYDGYGRVKIVATTTVAGAPDPAPIPDQQFGYDYAGRVVWRATRTPGSPYGKPTSLSDASVLSYAENDYDLSGRVTAERRYVLSTGEVLTKSYQYDDAHNKITITDRGVVTTVVNDGRGRLVSTTSPDSSVNSVVHNLGSDVVTLQTNSQGKITRTYNYDTRGLLLNVQDAKSTLLYQATYDDDGNQLTETRAGGGQVTWIYDSFDRLGLESKVLSATTTATSSYGYDLNDRLTTYYDAARNSPWQMTFTGQDSPLTITDPLGRSGTYTYSTAANWPRALAATVAEPNGRTTSYAYDGFGRVIDLFNGACPTTRDVWDCNGVLTSQSHTSYDASGNIAEVDAPAPRPSVSFKYDSLGRITDELVAGSSVHHAYTNAGRSITTDVAYGTTKLPEVTSNFDSLDRLSTVGVAGQTTPLATWNYGTGVGGPLTLAYSNGATSTYSYDAKLRQTGIDVTFAQPRSTANVPLVSLHEAFGADSIPRLRQHRIGTIPPRTDAFQVDSDGRITGESLMVLGVTMPTGEIANSDVAGYMKLGTTWAQYKLDNIGNVKQKATQTSTLVHTIDALSRLTALGSTSVNRDSVDNLTSAGGTTPQFSFDTFTGLLTTAKGAASTSTFTYDALGRRRIEHRTSDNQDHVYVWDGQRLVAHGTAASLTLDVGGDDIDSHVVSIDTNGTGSRWFYHQGPDQSVIGVSGASGLIEAYTYSAFGELVIWNANGLTAKATSTFGNVFQYQGQIFDASTATYSMRARQYRPDWGQFISPDPLSVGAAPSLYAFTGSRPLNHRDPGGRISCSFGTCYLDDSERGMAMASAGYSSSGLNWTDNPSPGVTVVLAPALAGSGNSYEFMPLTLAPSNILRSSPYLGDSSTEIRHVTGYSDHFWDEGWHWIQYEDSAWLGSGYGNMEGAVLNALVKLPLFAQALACPTCNADVNRMVENLTGQHLSRPDQAMSDLWLGLLQGLLFSADGFAEEALTVVDEAVGLPNGARGFGRYGGIFNPESNAAGGTVWTSTGTIAQEDFASIVNSALMRGEDVNLISGVHGATDGSMIIDLQMHADDVARFGGLDGVTVHNMSELTSQELGSLLNGPGTTIGGFCNSGACLAPYR